jgi:hypothetical protein
MQAQSHEDGSHARAEEFWQTHRPAMQPNSRQRWRQRSGTTLYFSALGVGLVFALFPRVGLSYLVTF